MPMPSGGRGTIFVFADRPARDVRVTPERGHPLSRMGMPEADIGLLTRLTRATFALQLSRRWTTMQPAKRRLSKAVRSSPPRRSSGPATPNGGRGTIFFADRPREMSGLPPKADIAERDHHVRFVPKADKLRPNLVIIRS
jgi:hypothetical protein